MPSTRARKPAPSLQAHVHLQAPNEAAPLGLWWLSITYVTHSKLTDPAKREKMTEPRLCRYADAQLRTLFPLFPAASSPNPRGRFWLAPRLSSIFSPVATPQTSTQGSRVDPMSPVVSLVQGQGGNTRLFQLLDIQYLTRTCGEKCTDDGVHYAAAVYAAALQNVLRHAVMCAQWRPLRECPLP
jgi:hypothetical protein